MVLTFGLTNKIRLGELIERLRRLVNKHENKEFIFIYVQYVLLYVFNSQKQIEPRKATFSSGSSVPSGFPVSSHSGFSVPLSVLGSSVHLKPSIPG